MTSLYTRAMKIGSLGTELAERSEGLCDAIRAIHRGDFASARWWLSMHGFCPDGSKEAHAAWVAAHRDEIPDVGEQRQREMFG